MRWSYVEAHRGMEKKMKTLGMLGVSSGFL